MHALACLEGSALACVPCRMREACRELDCVLLHACSCEQSVEMCPHGSPSAEAVAQDFDNSADSSPARALARDPRTSSRDAGQVRISQYCSRSFI